MKKTLAILVAAVLAVTALCACLTVSAEATNVAKGKSYTISQQFKQSTTTWTWDDNAPIAYPDDGGELTDGIFAAEDTGYSDAAWIGFHGGCPEYKGTDDKPGLGYSYMRVDLGEVYALSELKLYVGSKKLGSGITAPTTVEFYVSEDGKNYTGLGEITPEDTEETAIAIVSQETTAKARYVEIRMKREGNWMFVTEFEAYADAAGTGSTESSKDDSKTEETSSAPAESKPAESKPAESKPAESTPATSTPAASKPAESSKVPTGDNGIVIFAVLGVVAVAGACIVVRKRGKADRF